MKKHWLKIAGFAVVFVMITGILAGCDNGKETETSSDISSEESKISSEYSDMEKSLEISEISDKSSETQEESNEVSD